MPQPVNQILDTLMTIADSDTTERETMALVALFANEGGEPTPRHLKGLGEYLSKQVSRVGAAKSALAAELALHDVHFAATLTSVAWGSDPRPLWALLLERFGARPQVWEAALRMCGDDRDAYSHDVRLAARRAVFCYVAGALHNDVDITQVLDAAIEQAMGRPATHSILAGDVMFDNVRVTVAEDVIHIFGADGEVEMEIRVVMDGPGELPALCIGRRFEDVDGPHVVADALAAEGFVSAANLLRYL